jgi:chromosomal replication initiation ATPase DnaA
MVHKNVVQARKAYKLYISQGVARGKRPDLTGGGLVRSSGGWKTVKKADARFSSDERILGSSEFVDSALKRAGEEYEKKLRAKRATIEELISLAAQRCGSDPSLIRSTSKQRDASRAKGIVCCLAGRLSGMTGAAISAALEITPSAVCKLSQKGRDDPLSKEIEDMFFPAVEIPQ